MDIEITTVRRDGHDVPVWTIGAVEPPLIFIKPGTYPVSDREQRTAFSIGTVYFRHGAKSEPGTSDDLRRSFERVLARTRTEWLGNVRRVTSAPPGSVVTVSPSPHEEAEGEAGQRISVRLTDDPSAPATRWINPDKTHPYRQKELLQELNARLTTQPLVNGYDIQCVRMIHGIDSNRAYAYKPTFGSLQYSDEMLNWLVDSYERDPMFFQKAREGRAATRPRTDLPVDGTRLDSGTA